ncbi:unnamed protein product, partial [Prorocentrum cordatum]
PGGACPSAPARRTATSRRRTAAEHSVGGHRHPLRARPARRRPAHEDAPRLGTGDGASAGSRCPAPRGSHQSPGGGGLQARADARKARRDPGDAGDGQVLRQRGGPTSQGSQGRDPGRARGQPTENHRVPRPASPRAPQQRDARSGGEALQAADDARWGQGEVISRGVEHGLGTDGRERPCPIGRDPQARDPAAVPQRQAAAAPPGRPGRLITGTVAWDEDGGRITGATPIATNSSQIGTSSSLIGPHSCQRISPLSSLMPRGISRQPTSMYPTTERIQRLSPRADYVPPEATVSHSAPAAAGRQPCP